MSSKQNATPPARVWVYNPRAFELYLTGDANNMATVEYIRADLVETMRDALKQIIADGYETTRLSPHGILIKESTYRQIIDAIATDTEPARDAGTSTTPNKSVNSSST